MVYRIHPRADWPLVEEFRCTPIGHHSPNLMRLLNLLRVDTGGGPRHVLIVQEPLKTWVLGRMPPGRSEAIVIDDSTIFTTREDAEWAVFCARWQERTGIAITTSRHTPLPKVPPC